MKFSSTLLALSILSTTLNALPQSNQDTDSLSVLEPRAGGGGSSSSSSSSAGSSGGRSSSGSSSSSSSSGSRSGSSGTGSSGRTGTGSTTKPPKDGGGAEDGGDDGDDANDGIGGTSNTTMSTSTATRTSASTFRTTTPTSSVTATYIRSGADSIGKLGYLSALVTAGGVVFVEMLKKAIHLDQTISPKQIGDVMIDPYPASRRDNHKSIRVSSRRETHAHFPVISPSSSFIQ
ncbi:hypothetical protein E6O75_ATG01288 [Venturia nashicola]|uniref:Uncharacterized protein n=1 Tax=Venturia nashicola TaxID=86259 RepID=A0A4Z1PRN2_9PEZI|nr:hypothetical protein E6O75_ATG01288 [Venturia nashicola]